MMLKALVPFALMLAVMSERASAAASGKLECPKKFDPVSEYCLHVSTEYDEGNSPPLTWQEARQKCKDLAPAGWTSDLVILENGTKLSLLSKHFSDNYEAIQFLVCWVGAQQTNDLGQWLWLDGTSVDYYSNMWLPDQPPLTTTYNTTAAALVPLVVQSTGGSAEHYRLYMATYSHQEPLSSFVCEAAAAEHASHEDHDGLDEE